MTLPNNSEELGRLLLARGWHVATAESCTGGRVAHLLTLRPGSSRYYVGGVVSYTNAVKMSVLGVSSESIAAHTEVSGEVCGEMCRGVCRLMGAEVGIATTGIAGPTGARPGQPIGTVWIGVSAPCGSRVESVRFNGDREAVIAGAAQQALRMACELLGGGGRVDARFMA